MSQFRCHHPEFGGRGWGHPWPDEDAYPHACCIVCCPHASPEQRIAAGRTSTVRWMFLTSGSLDGASTTQAFWIAPEDIPGASNDSDVCAYVVFSDFMTAGLFSVARVVGDIVTFHSADDVPSRPGSGRTARHEEALRAPDELRGRHDD